MMLLLGGGGALLVLLSFLGIFITHRIVGPVYRMKRLCRQAGTARFSVSDRPLRRGDELEDLFDTFIQMIWSLKALQSGRLATLESTIEKAREAGVSDDIMSNLRALHAQMHLGLADVESLRPAKAGAKS